MCHNYALFLCIIYICMYIYIYIVDLSSSMPNYMAKVGIFTTLCKDSLLYLNVAKTK